MFYKKVVHSKVPVLVYFLSQTNFFPFKIISHLCVTVSLSRFISERLKLRTLDGALDSIVCIEGTQLFRLTICILIVLSVPLNLISFNTITVRGSLLISENIRVNCKRMHCTMIVL